MIIHGDCLIARARLKHIEPELENNIIEFTKKKQKVYTPMLPEFEEEELNGTLQKVQA